MHPKQEGLGISGHGKVLFLTSPKQRGPCWQRWWEGSVWPLKQRLRRALLRPLHRPPCFGSARQCVQSKGVLLAWQEGAPLSLCSRAEDEKIAVIFWTPLLWMYSWMHIKQGGPSSGKAQSKLSSRSQEECPGCCLDPLGSSFG